MEKYIRNMPFNVNGVRNKIIINETLTNIDFDAELEE